MPIELLGRRNPPQKPRFGSRVIPSHPLAQGLVGLWLFNEGGGSLALDIVGGNHARPNTVAAADWVTGLKGQAISTADDYWEINQGLTSCPPILQTAYMSIEGWFSWPTMTSNTATIALGDACGLLFGHGNNDPANWLFYRASSGFTSVGLDAGTYIGADTWRHVAQTYDGANIRVYVDGVQRASGAATGTLTYNTGHPAAFGRYYGNRTVLMAKVGIYNRALSVAEVQALYGDPYEMVGPPGRRYFPASAPAAPSTATNRRSLLGVGT